MSTLDARTNFAIAALATGYTSGATGVTVETGKGALFPQPSTDGQFNLVWWNSTDYPNPSDDPDKEIVRCTARSGDVLTITRAQEGTAATAKNTADKDYMLMLSVTAKVISDIESELDSKAETVSSPDGSNSISRTGGSVEIEVNEAHAFDWTARHSFNEVDIIKTPTSPATASVSFTPDGNGFVATGTSYQYYIYSYYYDGISYAYDASGIFTSQSDPNDSSVNRVDISWSTGGDANGYLIYDFMTGFWLDVGDVTSYSIDTSTSWNTSGFPSLTPTTLNQRGHPIWSNKVVDWTNTDFGVMAMGLSGSTHLQLRWFYAGGSGSGALRFESDDGTIREINANIYGQNAYFVNSLYAAQVSGYIYPTSMGANYVAYGGSGGYVTGDAKFAFNPSTNRLLISNTGITSQSQLHMHYSTATAIYTKYTNSSTGSTANDGFDIGIDSTGIAELRQRENTSIHVYVNNSLRTTWSAGGAGQLAHDGEFIETRNSIKTTDTYGVHAANQASATAGVPVQQPPMFAQSGHVWDTGASATRIIGFNIAQTYTSGNPGTGVLRFGYQYNPSGSFSASGFNTLMNLSSSGNLTIGNGSTVGANRLTIVTTAQTPTNTTIANSADIGLYDSTIGRFIIVGGSQADIFLDDAGAAANSRQSQILNDGGKTSIIAYNDVGSIRNYMLVCDHATGAIGAGGVTSPTAVMDLTASTTTVASLRIRSGTAPTSPNDGDIWQDGTNIKMRIGGVTKTFTLV